MVLPIADLDSCQVGPRSESLLLKRRRVLTLVVGGCKNLPDSLVKAEAGLRSVADCAGRWVLSPDAVLAHRTQGLSTPSLLRLVVMRFKPEVLQCGVVHTVEVPCSEKTVQF